MKQKTEDSYAQRVKESKERCHEKILYDPKNEKKLTQKENELLSLGLNFGIAPKKFPLMKYYTAVENLTRSLEAMDDPEAIQKAATIRNLALNEIRKGCGKSSKS